MSQRIVHLDFVSPESLHNTFEQLSRPLSLVKVFEIGDARMRNNEVEIAAASCPSAEAAHELTSTDAAIDFSQDRLDERLPCQGLRAWYSLFDVGEVFQRDSAGLFQRCIINARADVRQGMEARIIEVAGFLGPDAAVFTVSDSQS